MLSRDELNNGTIFVLKLWDVLGVPSYWAETLRGETARRWYDIRRRSDWEAVRTDAAAVFRNPVTQPEAERLLAQGRCVLVRTLLVEVGELVPAPVAC